MRPVVRPKPPSVTRANANCPHLCVEVAGKKPVGCSQLVLINLIGSGFNVDNHELAFILRTDPWPDRSVVDFVAAAGEFLFAVSRFWHEAADAAARAGVEQVALRAICSIGAT